MLSFYVPKTCNQYGIENMVNCVLAITELMWLTLCDQSNSNLYKTNGIKLSASLCRVAMVCILPAFPKISSRMKCAFGNQASISERCGFFEVHTNTPWSLTFFQFWISNASIGQNLCNVQIVGKESGFLSVCVMLGFVLLKCFNLPSCTNATNVYPIGSQKFLNHPLTQRWCPETPKNGCKKPPTPKSPKFVPKRRFHKRKSIRAGDLSKNRFFRVFALSRRKVAKTGIVAHSRGFLVEKRTTVVFL